MRTQSRAGIGRSIDASMYSLQILADVARLPKQVADAMEGKVSREGKIGT